MAKRNSENNNKLRSKYRFAIFNDTSHEELFVFRSNGVALILSIITIIAAIIVSVIALISFTSLKTFIPGYPTTESRREIVENTIKVDSLKNEIELWRIQLANIQKIVSGSTPLQIDSIINLKDNKGTTIDSLKESYAKSDSILRAAVMKEEQFNITSSKQRIEQIEGMHFYTPIKGVVTHEFSPNANRLFINISAEANSTVSAILGGTVFVADFSDQEGYFIGIQHSNNLISLYKHNSKLLKEVGDVVEAGTPIALAGSTGTLTNQPLLHFELWHNGLPINPVDYIKF